MDLIGAKIGRFTVIRECERKIKPSGQKVIMFLCKCECGNLKKIQKYQLTHKRTSSCGCYTKEAQSKFNTKHGMSSSKIYNIYRAIKRRIYNKNCKDYKDYGGRGIKIEWVDFNSFLFDMGESYKNGYSIERKDVNGNYCKDNCIWIALIEQSKNKRNTLYVKYNGADIRLKDLCMIKKINYNLVWQRIKKYNFTIEDAIIRKKHL